MKLEEIGFYTLSDNRAKNISYNSPLSRCELILTDRCNFNCVYCRGLEDELKGDIDTETALFIIDEWSKHNLKNIRFSGGEPTLYKDISKLVEQAKNKGIERIAVSTNGYSNFELYKELISVGVNDFSISLDACCASTGDKIAGKKDSFNKVIDNIQKISELVYTTVGIVLNEFNSDEVEETIKLSKELGVSDIRVIPAAQLSKTLDIKLLNTELPILKYRLNNMVNGKKIRGLSRYDSFKCHLVKDDMAIAKKYHYPCIIYLREKGNPIESIEGGINKIREDRLNWFNNHNSFEDSICRNNCLDVCVDFNNKCEKFIQEK